MEIKSIKGKKEVFIKNLVKAYTEGIYSDTPANRKLGRVGMSYKEWTQKQQGGKQQDNKNKEEINYKDGYAALDISKENLSLEDKNNLMKVQNFIKKKCDELNDKDFINVAQNSGGICIKMDSSGKISVDATGQVNWGRTGYSMGVKNSEDFSGYASKIENEANKFAKEINKNISPKKEKKSKTANFEKEIVNFAQEIGAKKKKDFNGDYYELETNYNGDNVKYKIRLHSDSNGPRYKQEKGALGIVLERIGSSGYNYIDCKEMTDLPFEKQVSYYKDMLKNLSKGNENVLKKTKKESGDGYYSISVNLDEVKEEKENPFK